MSKQPRKEKYMESIKNYNTKRLQSLKFRPVLLNVKLASNPFLKDQ